jgi:hypothetical protein
MVLNENDRRPTWGICKPALRIRQTLSSRANPLVQKKGRFSELHVDSAFRSKNGLGAVQNSRLQKQRSLYSKWMSKVNAVRQKLGGQK